MIRCTIEILPGSLELGRRTIGIVEIANVGGDPRGLSQYVCVLKKSPPFSGALKAVWKRGPVTDDDDVIAGAIEGFHRVQRGPYDLLYRALVACGLADRNKGN